MSASPDLPIAALVLDSPTSSVSSTTTPVGLHAALTALALEPPVSPIGLYNLTLASPVTSESDKMSLESPTDFQTRPIQIPVVSPEMARVLARYKQAIWRFLDAIPDVQAKTEVLLDMYHYWNPRLPNEIMTVESVMHKVGHMMGMLMIPYQYDYDVRYQQLIADLYHFLPSMRHWKRLRGAVIDSSMGEHVWDWFCSMSLLDATEFLKLQNFAQEHGIDGAFSLNKQQLCAALNRLKTQFMAQSRGEQCDLEEFDMFTGTSIGDIPPYRRHKLGNACYDILELDKYLDMPIKYKKIDDDTKVALPKTDPATQVPLTLEQIHGIRDHFARVKTMMHAKGVWYDTLRSNPILTRRQLQHAELSDLWGKLSVELYPVDLQHFMNATSEALTRMWDEMISYQVLDVRQAEDAVFRAAQTPQAKIEAMLDYFRRVLPIQDGYERSRLFGIAYALNHNIPVVEAPRPPPLQVGGGCRHRYHRFQRKRTPFKKR